MGTRSPERHLRGRRTTKADLCNMIKIGIIGPESTGKTALAQALAKHYRCPWEPEYARGYLEKHGPDYTRRDVEEIASIQILRELDRMLDNKGRYCFFDTELIITKVWFLHRYGSCPTFLTEHLKCCRMDYYLLCTPDLPWEPDPLRENGDRREYFFDWYKRELEELQVPYGIVSGTGEARLQCAISLLDNFKKPRRKKTK